MAVKTATSGFSSGEAAGGRRHRYCVYGFVIVSDIPLVLPEYSQGGLGLVEVLSADPTVFLAAMQGVAFDPRSDSWYQYASLRDGSTYVRWDTVGEFLVTGDGRRITCRQVKGSSAESFQVYLLGQALSFALVKQRFEPLHATAVVVGDEAVAFLGHNAFGKSTLAACFLEAGCRLLSDDLLILQESSDRILAYPGPPRIKLFPGIASRFLGHTVNPVQMNADTNKLILPVAEQQRCESPVVLKGIYSLADPGRGCRTPNVTIETLSAREAFVELVKGTFNRRLVTPERLERQFMVMTGLTSLISVKQLRYPRTIDRLQEVRGMVLADLAREDPRAGSAPERDPETRNGGQRWPFPSPTA
jgi:hypothetical protein